MAADPLDLDAIEARLKAATPGPWRACTWDFMERPHVHKDGEHAGSCRLPDLPLTAADAELIAHSITDLAALVAEARSSRAREAPCPICGHKWKRHDPEDGCCDASASDGGFGACQCGRSREWMNPRIAALSKRALEDRDGEWRTEPAEPKDKERG